MKTEKNNRNNLHLPNVTKSNLCPKEHYLYMDKPNLNKHETQAHKHTFCVSFILLSSSMLTYHFFYVRTNRLILFLCSIWMYFIRWIVNYDYTHTAMCPVPYNLLPSTYKLLLIHYTRANNSGYKMSIFINSCIPTVSSVQCPSM